MIGAVSKEVQDEVEIRLRAQVSDTFSILFIMNGDDYDRNRKIVKSFFELARKHHINSTNYEISKDKGSSFFGISFGDLERVAKFEDVRNFLNEIPGIIKQAGNSNSPTPLGC